jgi:hypothetical protein
MRRDASPSAQVVTMGNAKSDYSLGAIEIDPSRPASDLWYPSGG